MVFAPVMAMSIRSITTAALILNNVSDIKRKRVADGQLFKAAHWIF
jgi:hypothetical protein